MTRVGVVWVEGGEGAEAARGLGRRSEAEEMGPEHNRSPPRNGVEGEEMGLT